MRPGQAARSASLFFDLPGWASREKISLVSRSAVSSGSGNHAPRARAGHFPRVAQLVAIGGVPEGNEDGGAARCCYFCCGNGSCSANDDIRPASAPPCSRERALPPR